jgi:REP element-mobilizing transposase RayT
MYGSDGVYFVTARVFQGRFLMRPGPKVNQIVGGVLARAVRLCGVELHAYVVTSNHLHLVSSARDGRLSIFMRYLLGNLSRKLGPLVGWHGQFWERRFAAEPILGPESEVGRLTYLLSHGVKEGLVRSPFDWPGASCLEQLLTGEDQSFPFFAWAQRWRNGRLLDGGRDRFHERWMQTETLRLAPLPSWRELPEAHRRQRLLAIVEAIEKKGRETHPRVLGLAGMAKENPQRRPERQKRSPEPWCHADSLSAWASYRATYRMFATWFRAASSRFLAGELLAEFPPRAFRPCAWAMPGGG